MPYLSTGVDTICNILILMYNGIDSGKFSPSILKNKNPSLTLENKTHRATRHI